MQRCLYRFVKREYLYKERLMMITEERLRQTFSEGGAQEIYQEVKASGDFLDFARRKRAGEQKKSKKSLERSEKEY